MRTLVLILTVAFATSGFAHRLSAASDVQSEIYAVTYGVAAADICGGSEEHGKGRGCQACRLLAAFHMSPVEAGPVRQIQLLSLLSPELSMLRLSSRAGDAARPARAPPAV